MPYSWLGIRTFSLTYVPAVIELNTDHLMLGGKTEVQSLLGI